MSNKNKYPNNDKGSKKSDVSNRSGDNSGTQEGIGALESALNGKNNESSEGK